ncbi:ARPP-1 family domain-containing protein [Aquisphaera insulae]|uniref:ARPP-1 family domain-containing protein n=1 Tax=Aquisphaera insulae TaxID=2712864 RepID=UPI0013EDA7E4|nr:DUF6569 family protein [Aquisphaera insulae]
MSAIRVFPKVTVGQPRRHENLSVFPLLPSDARSGDVDYILSDEAISAGSIVVEEVSDSGSVPTLRVSNKGRTRVLFLEGQELKGAKQNRILNTSVLVAAGSKTTIPVSCVEQGRWRHRTTAFESSENFSSPSLRRSLKESVSRSLDAGGGHASDQMAVWAEVGRQMKAHGSSSSTMAMSDTYESKAGRIEEFRRDLGYVDGAIGLAVAVGPKVVAIDLFDQSATCRKVWDRLLTGLVLDALEQPPGGDLAREADVEDALTRLESARWVESPAAGEGREFRAEPAPHAHASALSFATSLLHGSAILS